MKIVHIIQKLSINLQNTQKLGIYIENKNIFTHQEYETCTNFFSIIYIRMLLLLKYHHERSRERFFLFVKYHISTTFNFHKMSLGTQDYKIFTNNLTQSFEHKLVSITF